MSCCLSFFLLQFLFCCKWTTSANFFVFAAVLCFFCCLLLRIIAAYKANGEEAMCLVSVSEEKEVFLPAGVIRRDDRDLHRPMWGRASQDQYTNRSISRLIPGSADYFEELKYHRQFIWQGRQMAEPNLATMCLNQRYPFHFLFTVGQGAIWNQPWTVV